MKTLKLNFGKIINSTKDDIKRIIVAYDNDIWKKDIESKTSLYYYKTFKNKIMTEDWIDNTYQCNLLVAARLNVLKLEWRERVIGRDTTGICKLCNLDEESLEHFILWCPALNLERNKHLCLQRPYQEEHNEIVANLLCFTEYSKRNVTKNKEILHGLWKLRKRIIENEV